MNEKQQLSCIIKLPVSLTAETKTNFHSGCKIVDVTFPSIINPEVGSIQFKNCYVAFITVKVKIKQMEQTSRDGPSDHGWRMAIKHFRLMPDPHAETGAQDIFSLTKKQFQCDMSNIMSLRIILQQPSPQWKDFKVEELKLFRSFDERQVCSLPAHVFENVNENSGKNKLEGVPDLDIMSLDLQQLWALAEEAASNQTQTSLGRFDVTFVDHCLAFLDITISKRHIITIIQEYASTADKDKQEHAALQLLQDIY